MAGNDRLGAGGWFGGYAEFLDHRHMPSGERPSQPWRMISRRMGVVYSKRMFRSIFSKL